MNDKEKATVKKRVQERIHAAKSFLKTADYLESRPPLPVRPRNDVPLMALKEEAEKEYYWPFIVVSRFHRAFVFEIGIKLVWELEKGKNASTHMISAGYIANYQRKVKERLGNLTKTTARGWKR